MNIAIVSGGFDPLHAGHIQYINKARAVADAGGKRGKLIAIVNKDTFLRQKKGYVCLSEKDRATIISNIRDVDCTIIAMDNDMTVNKTLEYLAKLYANGANQLYFCKGGDRNRKNIPEVAVCRRNGIRIIDGLGDKIDSSSDLINRVIEETK